MLLLPHPLNSHGGHPRRGASNAARSGIPMSVFWFLVPIAACAIDVNQRTLFILSKTHAASSLRRLCVAL